MAIGALQLARILIRKQRYFGVTWYPRTVVLSAAYGALSTYTGLWVGSLTYFVALGGDAGIWGASLLPTPSAIALHLGAGAIAMSQILLAVLGGWFLLNSETEDARWVHPSVGMGIVIAASSIGWWAAVPPLLTYFLAWAFHNWPESFRFRSPFRTLLGLSLMVTLYLYPVLSGAAGGTDPELPWWTATFPVVRLFLLVFTAALVAYPVLKGVTGRESSLFRGRERMQDRIVDRFVLAGFALLPLWISAVRSILLRPYAGTLSMDDLQRVTSVAVLGYFLLFALVLTGVFLLLREFLHPINQIRLGLQRVSAGRLDTAIQVDSRDEMGDLANAYNLMVYRLKDLQDDLADQERQVAWTEMARQVAHEIKNPLTPMKLSIQHLDQQIRYGNRTLEEIAPMISRITETLVAEIDSLSGIANDFSKFARPITEEFKETDLNEVVTSVREIYRHDHRFHLEADLSPEPLPVSAAPDELKRVILNLVKNSMEAIRPGGIVLVRTYAWNGGAYADVIDTGAGIPSDLKQKIFIPNFSTKNTGTGLGLAISKKVVEAHKGRIEFASAPGIGTTFTIRIPLISPGRDSETPATAAPAP